MKNNIPTIVLTLALGVELSAAVGDIHERYYTTGGDVYRITYEIKSDLFFTPATVPPGQAHYDCLASVYKDGKLIGDIQTQWTEKGCFEDDPKSLVERALGEARARANPFSAELVTLKRSLTVTNHFYGENIQPAFTTYFHLNLITNWTGTIFKDRELGYIATNHVAEIVYQGETNLFTLRTDASDKAVWRTNQNTAKLIFYSGTNDVIVPWHYGINTNFNLILQ